MNKDIKRLFVCAYGQSRSKWFAEKFMTMGCKALFCGYLPEADFILNKHYIEWADEIILLDRYIERENIYCELEVCGKLITKYYIDDEPQYFEEYFSKQKW